MKEKKTKQLPSDGWHLYLVVEGEVDEGWPGDAGADRELARSEGGHVLLELEPDRLPVLPTQPILTSGLSGYSFYKVFL